MNQQFAQQQSPPSVDAAQTSTAPAQEGSNSEQQEALDMPASGSATYAVAPGDSLSSIAQHATGDPMRYPELKDLNGLTSDSVEVGDMLQIPSDWDHDALGIEAPAAAPEESTLDERDVVEEPPAEGGWLDGIVELGGEAMDQAEDLWDAGVDVVEGAKEAWDDFWYGDEEQEQTPEECPVELAPERSELEVLMDNDQLTVEQIAHARELIELEDEALRPALYEQLQSKVEYLNQRNNDSSQEKEGGGTCNVTSLAMCLMYLGVANPDPTKQYEDALVDICVENGWSLTAGATWMKLGDELGATVTPQHDGQGVNPRSWYQETLAGWLQGQGVLVSIHGHVVRIDGVSEHGIIVDDPFGASILAGTTGREWTDEDGESLLNDKDADGTAEGNKGEDNLWPWENVEPFSFKCFYTVSA